MSMFGEAAVEIAERAMRVAAAAETARMMEAQRRAAAIGDLAHSVVTGEVAFDASGLPIDPSPVNPAPKR